LWRTLAPHKSGAKSARTSVKWVHSRYSWVCPVWKETLTRNFIGHSNTYTIFEGTSEIQRLIIARAISGVHIK
jgi:alkylation response protein AidB-like acyl-CoA dehydrogenase